MQPYSKTILACITAQSSCQRIIEIAKEFSKNLSAELTVITVQPLKMKAEQRSKDMVCLTTLSKITHSEIKIIYSDNPLQSIIQHAEEINPYHLFIGQGSEKSCFLSQLRLAPIDAPISVVGKDNIIYSLPPITEEFYDVSEMMQPI